MLIVGIQKVSEYYFNLQTVVVLICVLLVAGGIAYLGNQLGRTIGKRKMSILKLRPRHTSNVVTALTGALIAGLTLGVFSLFSEPVRVLLGGVEELRREEASLRETVESLKRTVDEGTFIWTKDEPIVHMTLPQGLPVERTHYAITNLLAEANCRAVLRNNKIAIERKDPLLKVSDGLIESDSDNLKEVMAELMKGTGVSGLQVVSEYNCLYRSKAHVRLKCWQVKLVYKKDEVVFRKKVSQSGMVTNFYQFIEDLKSVAKKKGMIPIDGSLGGGVSEEDFKALQAEMNSQEGSFYLVAKAKRDLYETNSLDVVISVEPISNKASGASSEAERNGAY